MTIDTWFMKQLTPQQRAVMRRRVRLVMLFSESYREKKQIADLAGFPMQMSREKYVNDRIRALRLPEVVVGTSRSTMKGQFQLSAANKKYEQEIQTGPEQRGSDVVDSAGIRELTAEIRRTADANDQ